MKEHWPHAEVALEPAHRIYVWAPPWPARVLGIMFSVPVVLETLIVGLEQVATDNHALCDQYPEYRLDRLPHGLVRGWRPLVRPHYELARGQQFYMRLAMQPSAGRAELLLEPLAPRAESTGFGRRKIAECLAALDAPLDKKRYS